MILAPAWYSFNVNCGGKKLVTDEGITYDDDESNAFEAAASFYHGGTTNWAYSSTGRFLNNANYAYVTSIDTLNMTNAGLYTNARASAISLTYYGFCLANGNYTVRLHFAEIIFTNDHSYRSLGRRVFDVYIQVRS